MKLSSKELWVLCAIHFCLSAQASDFLCQAGNSTKRIRTEENSKKACEMVVTGEPQGSHKKSIWHAHHQKDFCTKKQKAYVLFLEKQGWKCQEEDPAFSKALSPKQEIIRSLSFSSNKEDNQQKTVTPQKEIIRSLSLTGMLTTGVDSNVFLLPDTVYGAFAASPFISPSAQLDVSSEWFHSPIFAHLSAGYSSNLNSIARPYNNLPLGVSFEWQLPGAAGDEEHVSIQEEAGIVWLNPSDLVLFSVNQKLSIKKIFPTGSGDQMTVSVYSGYQSFPGVTVTPVNVRDGFNFGASLINQHTSNFVVFSESLTYTHQFAQGDNYKSDLVSLFGSAGIDLGDQVFSNLFSGVTYVNFPYSQYGRADTRFSVGAQISRPIEGWGSTWATLGLSHEDSISTQSAAQYQKNPPLAAPVMSLLK